MAVERFLMFLDLNGEGGGERMRVCQSFVRYLHDEGDQGWSPA